LRDSYNGCGFLISGPDKHLPLDDVEDINTFLFSNININEIGFGWVTNGKIATNDQPIVQNVQECKLYRRK
jgi:hypothetical protein